ncbi:MAG: hypothetical protein JWM90_1305 [Thermoleophilia bacterium]|nr:hypothetical protein [Thermoleophilia bacterium]
MDISRIFQPRTLPLLLASAALLVSGCGDDDDNGGDTTTSERDNGAATTDTTETDAAPAAPSIASSRVIELPGARVFPEGIALDESGSRMFVSSTTDGRVFTGTLESERLAPLAVGTNGPTAAIGLATGPDNALWVAGGDTGTLWRLDQSGGDVAGAHKVPGTGPTFLNDVAVAEDGTAYVTDSMRPVIYRITPDAAASAPLEAWLTLDDTAIKYTEGFNLNGIEFTPDDEQLLVVQGNTGKLFRIPMDGDAPAEVDLGDGKLPSGDGMEIDGQRMFIVLGDSGEVGVVDLADDFSSGTVGAPLTDPSFARPTTLEKAGDQLLVVNSQFNAMDSPKLPFTVSALALE